MKLSFMKLVKSQLVGKKLRHKNQYGRTVVLEVEDVTTKSWTQQITPDTPQNDWWGETVEHTNHYVHFVDGSKIEFNAGTKFEIVE